MDYGSSTVTYTNMDFSRLSQNVSSNIQKMSSQVSDVERMVRQIGTASDSTDLRDNLHKLTHSIHNMARSTGDMLKTMNDLPQPMSQTEQKQQKLLKERLLDQFSEALKRFQTAQNAAAKKEKESFVRARAHSAQQNQWNPFEDEGQKSPMPSGGLQQTNIQVEQDVDIQALREREDAIRKLEADISDVNQIFKDLAVMVHEQGDIIDNIENNVESAHGNVQQATVQLADARRYQSKARRKMVCIIGLAVVVIVIIALIIYFSVK